MAAAPGDGKNLAGSIFQKHDKDGSGALDKKEADDLIEDFCQTLELELSAKERQDLLTKSFNEADRNGDGVLSMPEFMSFAATLDSLASSLAGAVNPSGDTSESVVPTGYAHHGAPRTPALAHSFSSGLLNAPFFARRRQVGYQKNLG